MPEMGTWHDCNLCGQNFHVEKLYSVVCGVCLGCADTVANTYNMAHSGKWLTWPNEAVARASKAHVAQSLRWSVFRDDGFKCRMCGETEKPLHLDHITPSSRGGGNERENLQTLCETCNTSKGNR